MAASRASIASYTFPLIARLPGMENPTAEPGAAPVPGGENQPAAQQAQAPVLLPWKVAGIMTGQAGIKAIVMNGDQSAVLQAGDPLPDGTANVVSITPTGVIVRTTGAVHRTVKLDANDNNSSPTNNQGQPNMGQPGMPMPGGPGGAMPGMPNRGFPGGRPPGAV
jgi:hypothetical protein